MPAERIKFYQTGSFAVGNRLLAPDQRAVQADADRTNSLTMGHRACQGCGEALGARYVLDAVMRAAGSRAVTVNATGCLEVFSTPYPESSWRVAWLHSLFGNAPAVATGVAAALKAKGRTDVRVVGQGKSLPLIAMAHRIPYVATATVADLRDLEYKVTKAMGYHGARYLHVLVPCPLGWRTASDETIRIARLATETGIFPVFEAVDGEVTDVTRIRRLRPVVDYLRPQGRFAHLFGDTPSDDLISRIQAEADRTVRTFGLTEPDEVM